MSYINKLSHAKKIVCGFACAALPIVFSLALVTALPQDTAFAAEAQLQAGKSPLLSQSSSAQAEDDASEEQAQTTLEEQIEQSLATVQAALDTKTNKVLSYDPADIAAIGNQNESGHMICCPSYACAYADAVLDGTVHDHEYYTCSCCTWTDWGGGDSSFRCVGTDEEVLREAYDQISEGKPVVTHVSWAYGEHWITLIGYQNVEDPDHLTLDNFIALNPSDGTEIVASDGYELYGDGCQHISDR